MPHIVLLHTVLLTLRNISTHPPFLALRLLGQSFAGKGVISAQAFEGIIPMLKAGLNQSVHSDPAGLTEIDRMLHRMTTYVKDLSGSRTEPIK